MIRDLRIRARRRRVAAPLEALEDRALLSISVGATQVNVIKAGTNALFVVSLSAPLAQPVTVDYYTADGTAVAGVDYTTTRGTVTFSPGQTGQVVTVPVLDAGVFDPVKTFTLNLLNPIGDAIGPGQGVGTAVVFDNVDPPPQVTIDNFTTTESASGTTTATTTVHLSGPSGLTTTVNYSTADITAAAGSDYSAVSGTVTFPPGATAETIGVPIIGGSVSKGTKTFAVNLNSASNASIAVKQAVGTILDPNPAVGLSIDPATAFQSGSGASTAFFNVHLAAPSGQTVSVAYATADKTAIAGTDYLAASGALTFPAGATSETIPVTVLPSSVPSPVKQFLVSLSNPVNSTVGAAQALGTIINTVPGPNLSINSVQVIDSTSGPTSAVFSVSLSAPSNLPVSVNYATANLTGLAGTDYTATSGSLTFAPGQTVQTIAVPVLPATTAKPNALFTVNLTGATNALISNAQGLGTIVSVASPPFLVVNDVSLTDGPAGTTTNAVFAVTLSNSSPLPITVGYATANGSALAGTDYTPVSGTLTFAPGQTVQTISVPVIGTNRQDVAKQFFVNLSGPNNATVAIGKGTGTILNQSPAPSVSVDNPTATAPLAGTINANFTISLSAASGIPVTVNYATADLTAQAGTDYAPVSGTLTFAPGTTSKIVSVPILGQTAAKSPQTFALNLSNPGNAVLGTSQGIATILNTVAAPSVSIADATVVTVGAVGTSQAIFNVTLSAPSGQTVTVQYTTADGTATAGTDYTPVAGSLVFAPGQTAQPIVVPVLASPLFETDETFLVNLSAPTNAALANAQATGTIHNGSLAPSISIADASVTVGNFTTVNAVFKVSLSAPSAATTTVNYGTSDLTAVAGSNYTPVSGTLTFAPGQTTQSISVPVLDNLLTPGNVNFAVNLANPTNATLARATAFGTIIPNNSLAVTSASDDGPGSLRQAILRANAGPAFQTITFAIPGTGPFTINVRSPLPTITNPVTIDATTELGFSGQPLVELNGAGAGSDVNGLTLTAGNITIKGLAIDQFTGSGIFIRDRGGNVIQGNELGTNVYGNAARGNQVYGVLIDNVPNNMIGGPNPGDRNTISGNALGGIYIGFAGSSGNQVQGNYVGTDATGTFAVPNGLNGIFIDNAPNNFIGAAGAGNVVSGNAVDGIEIFGRGSFLNRIVANRVGVNAQGTAALVNGSVGILVNGAGRPRNIIGGPTAAERNVVVNAGPASHRFGPRIKRPAHHR